MQSAARGNRIMRAELGVVDVVRAIFFAVIVEMVAIAVGRITSIDGGLVTTCLPVAI